MTRTFRLFALVGLGITTAVGVACHLDTTGPSQLARFRFVNLTGTTLELAANGQTRAGFRSIPFGVPTTCLFVDPMSTSLAFSASVDGAPIGNFSPTLVPQGNYSVIAYPGSGFTTEFLALDNSYTPDPGRSGLRVVDLSGTSLPLDVVITDGDGTVYSTILSLRTGQASPFFSFPSGGGHIRVTLSGTSDQAVDVDTPGFLTGTNNTFILTSSGTDLSALESVFLSGC